MKGKSPPLSVWQENNLNKMKDVYGNPNGCLNMLISRLGVEITKLKESKDPSVVQIGKVLFLAEFVNNEFDHMLNLFDVPGSELAAKTTDYFHSEEFRRIHNELKKERDDTYAMLFDWQKDMKKQKIIDAAHEYTDYLLRFVRSEER